MANERIRLTFEQSRRQNNLYTSTVPEIDATVTLEAKGNGLRWVLRDLSVSADDPQVLGDFSSLQSATYAAEGHFADDLNALNGIDVPRMDRQ